MNIVNPGYFGQWIMNFATKPKNHCHPHTIIQTIQTKN